MTVSALILAGGKATRLGGIAKHELVIGGETILARQVRVLAPRVTEILVSCPVDVPGHRTVRDAIADAGPLAGIAAGLAVATTAWLLVIAGDMPDLRGDVLDLLLSPTDEDASAFRVDGLPEPLVCALRVEAFRALVAARLAAGDLKASRLLTDHPRVRWIDPRGLDPELRSLRNVNTAAEYAAARA